MFFSGTSMIYVKQIYQKTKYRCMILFVHRPTVNTEIYYWAEHLNYRPRSFKPASLRSKLNIAFGMLISQACRQFQLSK